MFSIPVPRRSFLNSSLRTQSRETRYVARGYASGDSHLGLGSHANTARPSDRSRSRGGDNGQANAGL